MICSKQLVRTRIRDELHKANEAECKELEERMQSEDCFNATLKFFNRGSKM
jgi:hypothetical protein